ncbi:hypothetical protein O1611_g6963 [Lasiodiplodia mahajangana]|uniref:Uncharacterized protein n=1 Tax=Lasiodiplodia mahajangana TaxID=1108764 RepID=A0ACC2JGT2_9PEZI|nr:hypothetical protein O1611_g6963 [Lasiodiplodia mahajangana]
MSLPSRHQKQLRDTSKLGIFKRHRQKRCNSFPPTKLVARGIDKPLPSTPLASKVKGLKGRSWLSREFKPEPVSQEPNSRVPLDVEGYESDEEDRRNGVPITYSPCCYIISQASMKRELEAEFRRLKHHGEELSKSLAQRKEEYRQLCESFSQSSNLSSSQWEGFSAFSDAYFNIREELFTVQEEMGHIHAQLRLFLDHSPPHDSWLEEEDILVWAPEEATGQQAALEWGGVDYGTTI